MLEVMLIRGALSCFQTMFGSLGVFFDCLSFEKPSLAVYAVLYLSAAMAILHATQQEPRRQ
jgi:hypothetical protein